jgi:hypothetical protein
MASNSNPVPSWIPWPFPANKDDKENVDDDEKKPEDHKSQGSDGPCTTDIPLADAIYLANPFTNRKAKDVTRVLVFVLPGNPGLIEYYRSFMTRLYGTLLDRDYEDEYGETRRLVWEVVGRSMGGFELCNIAPDGDSCQEKGTPWSKSQRANSKEPGSSSWFSWSAWTKRPKVYGLEEQITFMESRIRQLVQGQRNIKVVLVGHSVGSYILLELIRRHRERLETHALDAKGLWMDGEPDIVGGVCLFPTVMDIAGSSRGKAFVKSMKRYGGTKLMPTIISGLTKVLVNLMPGALLRTAVERLGKLVGRPREVTVGWLRSRIGLRQAL